MSGRRGFRDCPECGTENHVRRKLCSECEHDYTESQSSRPDDVTFLYATCSCGKQLGPRSDKFDLQQDFNDHARHTEHVIVSRSEESMLSSLQYQQFLAKRIYGDTADEPVEH